MSESRDDIFREMFFEEAAELLSTLEKGISGFVPGPLERAVVEPVYRAAHSLKGAAGMVGLSGIADLALALERSLNSLRSGAAECTGEFLESLERDRGILSAKVAEEERQFRSASS